MTGADAGGGGAFFAGGGGAGCALGFGFGAGARTPGDAWWATPGFATGLAGDGFEMIGLAGKGFEAMVGCPSGDFIGPFLMAACDTSVINMATAVKTAYAIILI